MSDYLTRHPGVQGLMRWLTPNPNLPMVQHNIASKVEEVAIWALDRCPDSPELTEGLRKLLEAKDCLVRASLA